MKFIAIPEHIPDGCTAVMTYVRNNDFEFLEKLHAERPGVDVTRSIIERGLTNERLKRGAVVFDNDHWYEKLNSDKEFIQFDGVTAIYVYTGWIFDLKPINDKLKWHKCDKETCEMLCIDAECLSLREISEQEYVGINVKLVTMRTMLLCGALCGVAGFLIVAGASHTVSESIVGGRGFTAVMISWLGHFNPLEMILYSMLNAVITTGSGSAAANLGYSGEVASVLSGIFFLIILVSEFFVNFRIILNLPKKNKGNSSQAEPQKEGGK